MGPISRTKVSLRFFGADLDPEEVTRLLGGQPTRSERKGEIFRNERTGAERVSPFGSWILNAIDRHPADLNAQIDEVLSGLTDDLPVWVGLTQRFRADVFCGLILDSVNEGEELSPETLSALGKRNLKLGLDIYGP